MMTKFVHTLRARPGASSITVPDSNSTTGDMDLTSFSSFDGKKDLRCRPGRVPKFKLWLNQT